MTRRRFQRGSIHKRGKRKKVWVARYSEDVIGPNGVTSRIRRSEVLGTVAEIPTLRQAEQLLAERLRLVNSSEYRPSSSRTFRDYVENCWLPEVLPTLKYSTKRHYQYMLRVHLFPILGDAIAAYHPRRGAGFSFLRSSVAGCLGEQSRV